PASRVTARLASRADRLPPGTVRHAGAPRCWCFAGSGEACCRRGEDFVWAVLNRAGEGAVLTPLVGGIDDVAERASISSRPQGRVEGTTVVAMTIASGRPS